MSIGRNRLGFFQEQAYELNLTLKLTRESSVGEKQQIARYLKNHSRGKSQQTKARDGQGVCNKVW